MSCRLLLVPVIISILVGVAWGEGPDPNVLIMSDSQPHMLPGTLAEFHDARSPLANAMSQTGMHPQTKMTKRIDLSRTIHAYAVAKKLSMTQARIDTLMFLGLGPDATGPATGEAARFKKVATDVLEITATEDYFRRLPAMQKCLELGKKYVRIRAQLFSISPSESQRVTDFVSPESLSVQYDRIPQIAPVATNSDSGEFKPFVATSTVTRQCLPVTTGKVTQANRAKLNHFINTSETAKILGSPILAALPGEAATVSTLAYKPYVVGTESTIAARGATVATPTIQTLEDGATVRVKAIPSDGKIQLMTDIAISHVKEAGVFKAPNSAAAVQQPSQRLRQVHMAALVEPGTTVFVDPNLVEPVDAGKGRSTVERRWRISQDHHLAYVPHRRPGGTAGSARVDAEIATLSVRCGGIC